MSPVSTTEIPVLQKVKSTEINSIPTEITLQDFSNRLVIFISQVAGGRLGSFVEVTQDKPSFDHFDPSSNTLSIKVLFGIDTEEILLASRIFAGGLGPGIPKPILFSVAIKDFSKENLFAVRDFLVDVCKN